MFRNYTFILSNRVQAGTITIIKEHGGRVRSSVRIAIARETEDSATAVTIGVQADAAARGDLSGIADSNALRALRLTVVHERWVRACALAGEVLPIDGTAFVTYDPFPFDGVEFTTTQLPQWVKANVVAALQFHGAVYAPHLTSTTHLVVHNELHRVVREGSSDSATSEAATAAPPQGLTSRKLQAAQTHHVPQVTVGWVLRRLAEGRRVLPALADLVAADHAAPKSLRSLSQQPSAPPSCSPAAPAAPAPQERTVLRNMVQHFAVQDRVPREVRERGRPRSVESDARQWVRLDCQDEENKENVDPALRFQKKSKVVKL